jgi:hypothetical protein
MILCGWHEFALPRRKLVDVPFFIHKVFKADLKAEGAHRALW